MRWNEIVFVLLLLVCVAGMLGLIGCDKGVTRENLVRAFDKAEAIQKQMQAAGVTQMRLGSDIVTEAQEGQKALAAGATTKPAESFTIIQAKGAQVVAEAEKLGGLAKDQGVVIVNIGQGTKDFERLESKVDDQAKKLSDKAAADDAKDAAMRRWLRGAGIAGLVLAAAAAFYFKQFNIAVVGSILFGGLWVGVWLDAAAAELFDTFMIYVKIGFGVCLLWIVVETVLRGRKLGWWEGFKTAIRTPPWEDIEDLLGQHTEEVKAMLDEHGRKLGLRPPSR